ncbi:probable G-protein coupled receptor 139 [Heptranchias perlo]|uniref:probable G-protein coupled receptor 139 n=1 Tax=Heptranchias perlo TaxID=212740 RepID=UPI00355A7E53
MERPIIHQIEDISYPILAAVGVPVNILAIVILSRGKCGLSTCITRYLVAMATADLLFVIIDVILFRLSDYYFPGSFLDHTSVCTVNVVLLHAAMDSSVWLTVTFSFDRFVAICWQKLKTKYCTEKTAAVVIATTCILSCLKNVPWYFAYEPWEIIDNAAWGCVTKASFSIDPRWVAFDWFGKTLTPLLPFVVIVLLNALTVRCILVASRVRKRLRGQSQGENRNDPEMESRKKSVILLFTVSGTFILLWLLFVIHSLYYSVTNEYIDDVNDASYISGEIGYLLKNSSSCTNTFIYLVTQTKFREQLKSAVKYPVTGILKLIKQRKALT